MIGSGRSSGDHVTRDCADTFCHPQEIPVSQFSRWCHRLHIDVTYSANHSSKGEGRVGTTSTKCHTLAHHLLASSAAEYVILGRLLLVSPH